MEADLLAAAYNVWKSFNGEVVLAGVTVEVHRGEVVGIVGPNGCGKTTLLRMLAGLLSPDAGTVVRRGVALMVFQDDLLLPWKRIWENIALGLIYRGVPKEEARRVVYALARDLGIEEHLEKYPMQVSKGTARKAAIARMLALEPDVLLLDEPFSGLDPQSRRKLIDLVRRLARRGGSAIIVDHFIDEVAVVADRIYVLSRPPTKVQAVLELKDVPPSEKVPRAYEALARLRR